MFFRAVHTFDSSSYYFFCHMPTFNTHLVLFLLFFFFAPLGVEGFVSGVFLFCFLGSSLRNTAERDAAVAFGGFHFSFGSRIQRVSGSKPYTHECEMANEPPHPPPPTPLLFLNLQPMAFFIFFYTLLIYQ